MDMRCAVDYLKPALTALILVSTLLVAGSAAQERASAAAPQASAPKAAPATPAQSAPKKKKLAPRRPVQQQIARMPPAPPVATEGYRPALTPRAPLPPAAAGPAAPAQLNSCDRGGCTDTGGVRYNGGVGNTAVSPRGQLCTRGPGGMQCF